VVLFVATDDDPMRRFEPSEVELLRHLASLAAEAVEDLSIKAQLDSAIYARATELAAVRQFESGLLARPPVDEGELARAVGSRLGLDPGALVELEIAARVSEPGIVDKAGVRGDVGAVGSHDRSTEPLLRADPVAAADRLAGLAGFEGVALVVRFAGERWDARGRQGLPGPRIPLASRILAACDALRVLTSIRPWGRGATVEGALRGIQAASGKVFDPAVIAALSSELIGELPDFGESNPTANWAKADAQYSEVL
jgi:response regulator RpfG family c-di-GMP phosphodiesterase